MDRRLMMQLRGLLTWHDLFPGLFEIVCNVMSNLQ